MKSINSTYDSKPNCYFTGARKSFVDDLPYDPSAKLLEIGCGNGDTAAYALKSGKCGWCAGIELCAEPAHEAKQKLNQVIVGDIECIVLPFPEKYFDVLLMSEVIEHLCDPWSTLRTLHGLLKPGAWCLAGSPNVAHRSVLKMLLRGRWDYADVGLMDWTHMRWFTPKTYRQLFEECGYQVFFSGPAAPLRWKAQFFNCITLGSLQHLLHTQIYLKAKRL